MTARRPVRVTFLIDKLSRAGTESQLVALIRELDRSRVEPSLVLLDGESEESRSLEPSNCEVLRLGVRSIVRPAALRKAWRFAAFLRNQRTDVCQIYFNDSLYFGVPIARLVGVPFVLRVRNNLGHFLTPTHRKLSRVYGRAVTLTLTNSVAGRDAIVRAEGIAPRRVVVLENGVDLERFSDALPPDTRRPEGMRVGLVGNLRAVKNIDGLIRAATLLPGCRFEVAGEGTERASLQSLIEQNGIKDRFSLIGSIADVPGFLARQDVAVLCSHSEGMSNALMEYMASGRAIVATDVGANAQLIEDGQQGLVVPPSDDRALAAAIRRYLDDPAFAVRMGANAREKARAEFSRAAMRQRFEAFYEHLVG